MTVSYMECEIRIAAASAFASENIMRENATSESLKKLDEIGTQQDRLERKQKNKASFQKTIDMYVKQGSLQTE